MSYTTNPKMPKLRRDAVRLIYQGWSARKVGRYLGFHHTAVMKWMKYAKKFGDHPIPTKSSRPKHHPKELSETLIENIVEKRLAHHRYAEVVHRELQNEGIVVSLSSVKRTLDRRFLDYIAKNIVFFKEKEIWFDRELTKEKITFLKKNCNLPFNVVVGKEITKDWLSLSQIYEQLSI